MVNAQKLEELIVHLAGHKGVGNLGPTKLWKLIYFIDAKAMRDLGTAVTGSEFIKYEHGPVPSRGEKHLKKLNQAKAIQTQPRTVGGKTLNELKSRRPSNTLVFSAAEFEIIEHVCAELGGKSARRLSNMSHKEPAWHYAEIRGKLSAGLIVYGYEEDPDGL